MAESRVLALIVRRKNTGDESLLLETLVESGDMQAFRLPGILKSRKRSAFYFAPGALCEILFHSQAVHAIVPKSIELVFSPFSENQDYQRLNAVAEILKTADFLAAGPENAAVFSLMRAFLENFPPAAADAERHTDRYYWEFLKLMGLAHQPDSFAEIAAFDLAAGFLSEREVASLPASDLRLPAGWITGQGAQVAAAHCREIIRRFLSGR